MEHNDLDPPDEWDHKPGTDLDDRAAALRAAWIASVRHHHSRSSGNTSRYNSNVRWDGGFDRLSKKTYQPVWPSIVTKADDSGFDAMYLMKVLFESIVIGNAPIPYQIVAPENINRAKSRAPLEDSHVRLSASTESVVFRSALWAARQSVTDPNPNAAVRHVLNDLGRDLSPLFRFCIAAATDNSDIASRWQTLAVAQLMSAPKSYLSSWSHLLPPGIVELFKGTGPEAKDGIR